MSDTVLQVRGLRKVFADVCAVDGLDFSIIKGQCFGLLGPNGAGKTTTLDMLEGIENPTAGVILYRNRPIPRDYQSRIGIQFQSTALQDHLTPYDNLKLFSGLYENPKPIDELVDTFELNEFLHRDVKHLSGGQRQKLLLALALVHDPEIVFLDEPTTGLDPRSRRDMWDVVLRLKSQGNTLILTTHYMEEAEVLCDYLVILSRGKVLLMGSPQQLIDNSNEDTLDALFLNLTGENLVETTEVIR